MTFYQKDELGINRVCDLISEYEFNGNNYVIYTDMLKDNFEEDFRLLAGTIINNEVVRLEEDEEKEVLNSFKNKSSELIDELMEVI